MLVYNRYRHRVHGEEVVVDTTMQLLRDRGVEVSLFVRSSEGLAESGWKKLAAGVASIYNPVCRRQLSAELTLQRPDVIHAHNLYPWISPSALIAAKRAGIPVVMTVHHYGLTCPVLTHFRDGQPCTECVTASELSCVRHNCRKSPVESGLYALRTAVARRMRWFLDHVAVFIALSEFSKRQLIDAGFPADRIAVRPNMMTMPVTGPGVTDGDYVAYAGRITDEKGVDLLCDAARLANLPLRIAGDGSARAALQRQHAGHAQFDGVLRDAALQAFYLNARCLVVPSRWWEVCPLVVLEAMSLGVPVIASRIGGLQEMIEDGVTGLLFEPGNCGDLVAKMRHLWNDPALRARLAVAARLRASEKYGAEPYFSSLMSIYSQAREESAGTGGSALGV